MQIDCVNRGQYIAFSIDHESYWGHSLQFRQSIPARGEDQSTGALLHSKATYPYTSEVYSWCMARTNIDLDDSLVAEVMSRFQLSTKREAVDLALRRLVGVPLTQSFFQELRGVGWEGDLDEMRDHRAGDGA